VIDDIPTDKPVRLDPCGTWPESVHSFDERSADALVAALGARRPLLVQGEPGVGKSQLARAAAAALHRAFISHVVHARSEAQDLQWEYDAVSRLAEAQVIGSTPSHLTPEARLHPRRFLVPGALWWAFNWTSATEQNDKHSKRRVRPPPHPDGWQPKDGVVLLIDEIDKADADLPNSLLETLGNGAFPVPWLDEPVGLDPQGKAPLVVVTTNQERELPRAFLRRCMVLRLELPAEPRALEALLVERGAHHFGNDCDEEVRTLVARRLIEDRERAKGLGYHLPGQAEYLDCLRALVNARGNDKVAQIALFARIAPYALQKRQDAVP